MGKLYFAFLCCFLALLSYQSFSQQPSNGGFGGFFGTETPREEQVSLERLKAVSETLTKNVSELKARGVIKQLRTTAADTVKMGWPLRQAVGFNDPGYYGISNYIDQDPRANFIKEYNCGQRTYDGHRGTDIYTYPYFWKKMVGNEVEIIAAADGVIVAKYDGNPDTSCANCDPNSPTCQWNAVFVKSNIDGTIVWYGHMKKNSQTTKAVGAAVTKGEYLGIVGSAGNSTGPHLHLEVWLNENYNFLVDPWEGTCNGDHNSSFWANQQAYYMPGVIKVASASGVPQFSECYGGGQGEQPKTKDAFTLNETVYLPVFIRDNIVGKKFLLKIISPSGVTKYDWSLNAFNSYYSSAWFYYFYPAATTFNEVGAWKFVVTYENSTAEHAFNITQALPLTLLNFSGENEGKTARLFWKTSVEQNVSRYVVERSADGTLFESIGSVSAKGNNIVAAGTNDYKYTDALPLNGSNYYRLEMFDIDGRSSLSNVVKLSIQASEEEMVLLTNPASSELKFVCASDYKSAGIQIIDQMGRTVYSVKGKQISRNQQTSLNITNLATGHYYIVIQTEKKQMVEKFVKR